MPTNDARRDEIRKILLSLLLARPGTTSVTVLDRDYFEVENERIPWRKFGYANIVEFLKSMPEYFELEWCNGMHYVRGIASEKTKHVSSLVSRQKFTPKSKYIPPQFRYNFRPYVNRHLPQMQRQRIRIPAEQLSSLVKYIKNNPNGVSMRNVMQMLQKQLPHVVLSMCDIREQLRELSHSLYLDCDMIYPKPVNDISQETENCPQPPTLESQNVPRSPAMCVGGDEGSDILEDNFSDEDIFDNYLSTPKQPKTSERLTASFGRNANNEENAMFNHNDDVDVDEYFAATNNNADNLNTMITDYVDSSLISDRIKSRLDQLVRKHPEGIWCADLPEKYFKEYNIQLNYSDLGFISVRQYVSYLPDIFYMTRVNSTDDFLLYSADKRPTVPDQELTRTEPIEIRPSSRKQHDEHDAVRIQCNGDDNAPIPADVSPTITKTFAPDDVMNYDDSVDQILVTDLQRIYDKRHLEVYIVEIFNPSFFWVHLRENKRRFDVFMDDLHTFYEYNKDKYTIPKIALKKGLNCACIYANRWHRGIIKSVKPDFKVTVMFYDYGTLKMYAPEDVYYLHKQFSFLFAQAIPCGLFNVRPCVGDRWKKSVTDQLIDKINETLLALTIVTVDSLNNSMMVILSDTSEEEDVHINDWLIDEKLAQRGKMVRICDNFSYLHYLKCNNITIQSSVSNSYEISDIINVDKVRYDSDQSILCNKGAHTLFDVKNKNNAKNESKTAEALHNVISSKKALLRNINSLDSKSSDVKSQSTDYSKNEKPNSKKLLEKLRTLNIKSNSNSSISSRKPNHDFKDNVQQIDSDKKTNSQDDNGKHFALNMDFNLRDSDNEENNAKDFGTFRSLYGGNGLMEPCDWSIIKNDNFSCKAPITPRNNLDILIKEYKNNITEDESESHTLNNKEKESSLPNPFFNLTRKEEEYYLPENNINYDFKNVSPSVAKLRNRMQIYNDKYTPVVVTKNILKTLSGNIPTQDKDFDADTKLVSSNMINNEDCKNKILKLNNKKTFECNTDSSSVSTSKSMFNPRIKMLMNQMKRRQMNSVHTSTLMDFANTRDSTSSEQIQSSSCSHSNTTTDSSIISIDEEHDVMNQNTKLSNSSKLASTNSFSLDYKSKESRDLLSSENDSIASFNMDDSKQNQSVKVDLIVDNNVDDSKQPNVTTSSKMPRTSKILELVLKKAKNTTSDIELDSDDLSNQETIASDKNCDKKEGKLIELLDDVKCKSTNNDISLPEKTLVPPILNDCDIESDDSYWDVGLGYVEPLLQFRCTEPIKISDDESERI